MSEEKYFPRGPVLSVSRKASVFIPSKERKSTKSVSLFNLKPPPKKSHTSARKRLQNKEIENSAVKLNNIVPLNYESLQPGLLVMGCVKNIFSTSITINLPGNMIAHAYIDKISTSYNHMLSAYTKSDKLDELPKLEEFFRIGELVTCCIEKVSKTDGGRYKVTVSLNPSEVNADKTERILEENVELVGAIKTREDHGYIIDVGIDKVSGFLPEKTTTSYLKLRDQESLYIGQIVRVAVKKVLRVNVGLTNIEFTLESNAIAKSIPRSGFTVDNLTPGQRMKVFIKQVLHNGIEVSPVHAFEDYNCYVHISHLPDVWGDTSGLVPGKVFTAVFLYGLMPVNILYFSLKQYQSASEFSPAFIDGTIVEDSKVIGTTQNCVYLQLGSRNLNAKGYVHWKEPDGKKAFSTGETIKTRVLHYDYLQMVYLCSLNPSIVSAEYFNADELKVGQIIKCTVKGFKEGKGLEMKLGTIDVFAPLDHLSDHPQKSKATISGRFKVDSTVTARILKISYSNNITVTLKPTLLSSDALCSHSDAVINKCYYGKVHSINNYGILVRFFGDILGFVPNGKIVSEITGLTKDSFQIGQLIRCYVVFVDPSKERLILSLTPPDTDNDNLTLGSSYKVIVTANGLCGDNSDLCNQYIQITIADTSDVGILPAHELTDHVNLIDSIIESLKPGQVVDEAVLYNISDDLTPMFTLRSSMKKFIQMNPLLYTDQLPEIIDSLVVPCSVNHIDNDGFHINVNLPNYNETYFIDKSKCPDLKIKNVKENQSIMAVVKIQNKSLEFEVSSENFNDGLHKSIEILEDYLNEAEKYQEIKIGEKYKVKINSISDTTYGIQFLGKNVSGSFIKEFSSGKIYCKNKTIEVVALWQDPKTKHVYVHPNTRLRRLTDSDEVLENLICQSFVKAQVLLLTEDIFVSALLSDDLVGLLTVLPSRLHYNDFTNKKPTLLSKVSVLPCKSVKNLLLSIREKPIKSLSEKIEISVDTIVSQLKNSIINNSVKTNKTFRKKSTNSEESSKDLNISSDLEIVNSSQSKKRKGGKLNPDLTNGSLDIVCDSAKKKKKRLSESNDMDVYLEDINSSKSKINKGVKVNGNLTNGSVDMECDSVKNKKKKIKLSESLDMEIDSEDMNSSKSKKRKSEFELIEDGDNDIVENKKKSRKQSESENSLNNSLETTKDSIKKKKKKSIPESQSDMNLNLTSELNSSSTDKKMKNIKQKKIVSENNNRKVDYLKANLEHEDNDSDSGDSDEEELNLINQKSKKIDKNKQERLSLNGSQFCWNVNANNFFITNEKDDDDDNEDEGDLKSKKPKTKKEKKEAAKEAEKRLRMAENMLLEAQFNPQSADHFERLTVAQPNNSIIWVKYIAYHLQATEIEKARSVANRALKTISYSEDKERFNIWSALLNLENLYGTPESLKKTLDEAVRTNDEYTIYSKMAEIYTDSDKSLEVDQLTNLMLKKFKTNLECYLLCCRCLLRCKLLEKARSVFQKGLQHFPKKLHVQYITRFALMENTYGSTEHAQTLMEHVLTSYPGRICSWITYVDMLIKSSEIELARNLMERSVGQKFNVKKMKTLYKKWLQFEEQYGTDSTVNHVREMASQYVNSLNTKIDSNTSV